jgi:cysteine desulfurase/selenocysteine lyase
VSAYEEELLAYATRRVSAVPGVRLIGTADRKVSVVSFVMEGVHAHDLGTILDAEGIAVRTGHHCAMPVMEFFKVPATARASLAFYNTREEIDRLAAALGRAREVFA